MKRLLKIIAEEYNDTDTIIQQILNNKWFKSMNDLNIVTIYLNKLFTSCKVQTITREELSLQTNMLKQLYEMIDDQTNIYSILEKNYPNLKNKSVSQWSIQACAQIFEKLIAQIDFTDYNKILLSKISHIILKQFNLSDDINSIFKIRDALELQITNLREFALPFLTLWNVNDTVIRTFLNTLVSDRPYYETHYEFRDTINTNIINSLLFKRQKYSTNDMDLTEIGRELKKLIITHIKIHILKQKKTLLLYNNDTALTNYLQELDYEPIYNKIYNLYPQYAEQFEKSASQEVLATFITDITNDCIQKELKNNTKYSQFTNINAQIINAIINLLPTFIDNIIFPTYDNGYYKHSWLDSDQYEREDANPVFNYLINNNELKNKILQTANVTETELNTYMNWNEYITKLKENPYITENFHLEVRKYLVARNPQVAIQKSEKINAINDKKQIVKINDQGKFIDKNNNIVDENTLPYIEIDFDPRSDDQRERPIVIIREFKKNNKYKDHVIIGEQGANHGSILYGEQYQNLMEASKTSPYEYTFACCYLIGTIAIVDQDRYSFPSIEAIVKALKKSHKFTKIYIIDNNNSKHLHRLAKKI